MENIPWFAWFAWIAIVGIIAGATSSVVSAALRSREKRAKSVGTEDLRALVQQSVATNQVVVDKLDLLETRLASVENTLTDIP